MANTLATYSRSRLAIASNMFISTVSAMLVLAIASATASPQATGPSPTHTMMMTSMASQTLSAAPMSTYTNMPSDDTLNTPFKILTTVLYSGLFLIVGSIIFCIYCCCWPRRSPPQVVYVANSYPAPAPMMAANGMVYPSQVQHATQFNQQPQPNPSQPPPAYAPPTYPLPKPPQPELQSPHPPQF
ncbi:hypothetical protein BSLG_000683 [Batrachochytrium salamandrivorans]|nr:hypothetical protein BASA83_002265 [Batrachochytrium salamandrivorans]KAJ1345168.1 hypothetical protein BSLG_000683 [Batrachochytrium salamandrivorans]